MLNTEIIEKLIQIYTERDDSEGLEILCEEIEAFEDYHKAIYTMEIRLKVNSARNVGGEEYRNMTKSLDDERTMRHNRVLTAVRVLNRLAEGEGLSPVYDGVVSEERPYRREVANAVLEYVGQVIRDRR